MIIWCNLTKITKETLSWSDELYPKSFLQEEPMMTGSGAIVYMTDVCLTDVRLMSAERNFTLKITVEWRFITFVYLKVLSVKKLTPLGRFQMKHEFVKADINITYS